MPVRNLEMEIFYSLFHFYFNKRVYVFEEYFIKTD